MRRRSLWRRQPDADLYRDRPGQRRHALRRARHHRDRDLERRGSPYAITQGTLAASSNYALSYVGANLTVTAAALTVTANAQTRALRRRQPDADLCRDRPGQRRHADRRACHHGDRDLERRSPYAITQGTLAASSNYALSYAGANLTVTAAALTVTANAQTQALRRCQSDADLYETGLVNGDTLTGALATTATATSNVGALRHHPGHARRIVELRAQL